MERRCWSLPPSSSLFWTLLPRPPLRRLRTSCPRRSGPGADWLWWAASARGSRRTTAAPVPWSSSTSSAGSGTRFSPVNREESGEWKGSQRGFRAQMTHGMLTVSRTCWLFIYLFITCESFRPSLEASFFLSGLLMYFCFWNIFSKALRCTSENTALLSIPLRGLPLAARGHENVPGMGTTDEDAKKTTTNKQKRTCKFSFLWHISENMSGEKKLQWRLKQTYLSVNKTKLKTIREAPY